MKATTVGLAIGKSAFQVHVADAAGQIVAQRRLRRAQVTTFFARLPASVVGIEACGSAHCWGRELQALGHEVRLLRHRADDVGGHEELEAEQNGPRQAGPDLTKLVEALPPGVTAGERCPAGQMKRLVR